MVARFCDRQLSATAYAFCAPDRRCCCDVDISSSFGLWPGSLAAVAAILLAFYTNSISPSSHGNFYELYAIAAAVLGGCSLRGGEGSIIGIVTGTALLQVLRNLVNLLDIPSSLDFAVMGAVILIGVIVDQVLRSRKQK